MESATRPGRERVRLARQLLPPIEDLLPLLGEIWDTRVLSNSGILERRLEATLESRLGWRNVAAVANCTLGMQLLIRAHGLEGEVIVSGLSHPATYQAVRWNGLTAVPADIEADYLTLDPERLNDLITARTSAILAVHLFGNPADVVALEKIAAQRGLVLLYDAASAFAAQYDGVPLTRYGDGSAVSFHATKLLGMGEGGAITARSGAIASTVRSLRNFGLAIDHAPAELGTNAKLNELACALGLALMPYIMDEIRHRQTALAKYKAALDGVEGVELVGCRPGTTRNFAYAALRLRTPAGAPAADSVQVLLDRRGIDSRRYFGSHYRPRLNRALETPQADAAAEDLLCVPLWGGMRDSLIEEISDVIRTGVGGTTS